MELQQQSVTTILDRVGAASTESRLAVFKKFDGGKVLLTTAFENTVETTKRLKTEGAFHVGSYHIFMDRESVREELENAKKL